MDKIDWDKALFALVLLLGFGYIYSITFFQTCEASKDWVNVILGFILGTAMGTLISWKWGSSKGSEDKSKTIENIQKRGE